MTEILLIRPKTPAQTNKQTDRQYFPWTRHMTQHTLGIDQYPQIVRLPSEWFFRQHKTKRKKIWAATRQNQQCGCAPSEDSDQPGHPPSLIRVFAVRMKKAWVLSYPLSAQRRLWSDWPDAQSDLSLRWAHTHFVGFVTRRLVWAFRTTNRNKQFHENIRSSTYVRPHSKKYLVIVTR